MFCSRLTSVLFLFSVCMVSCGSGSLEEVSDGAVSATGGDQTESQYQDRLTSISDSGDKIVFISDRLDGDGNTIGSKVYTYDTSLAPDAQPARLTAVNSTYGEELKAQVSPNGAYVAFISKSDSGVYQLYLQSWDGSVIGQISTPESLIRLEDLEFSADSNGLVYSALVSENGQEVYVSTYVKIALSGTFSFGQVSTSSNEWNPKLSEVGGGKYLITQTNNQSFETIFKTYLISESGSPTISVQRTSASFTGVDDNFLVAGPNGVYFRQDLSESRTKERLGDLAAAADGTSLKGSVVIRKGVNVSPLLPSSVTPNFTLSSSSFTAYEPTEVYGLDVVETNLLAIFGGDYHSCVNGGVYQTSLILYNYATDVSLPLAFTSSNGLLGGVVADVCSAVVQGVASASQEFEQKIVDVKVKGTLADGFKALIVSKDSGDSEVYLVSFKVASMAVGDSTVVTDSNIGSVTVVEISKNRSS